MPFIHIGKERWQKLKQLFPTPTRRSLRERISWAIDHEIMLTLDGIDIRKQVADVQRESWKPEHT